MTLQKLNCKSCMDGKHNDCVNDDCLCRESHEKIEFTSTQKFDIPKVKQEIKERFAELKADEIIRNDKKAITYLVDIIREKHDFITLRESDELLLHDGKIYSSKYAESVIKEYAEKMIEDCTKHNRLEAISKMKAQTGKDISEFDSDSNFMTVENGILHLDSLELEKHTPYYLSRVLVPLEYKLPDYPIHNETIFDDIEKNLKDTLFWKFLKSSFTIDGVFNKEDFETVLEITASFFVKKQINSKAFLFLGKGENGKSVLLDYIESMLGKDNVSHIPLQDISEDKFARAELNGKSANIYSDLEVNELKESGKFKSIIENEPVQSQKKYGHPFQLRPFAKMIFSCNRFPKVYDQGHGFFRRWIIIKWERNFEKDPEKDPHLKEKLKTNMEEKTKVFSCLVYLARKLNMEGKFTHQRDSKEIQKEWNANADPLDDFVNNYILDSDTDTSIRETYHFYKEIMISKNERPLGIGQFGKAFSEYYDKDKVRVGERTEKVWLNISLKRPKQESLKEYENV